MRTLMQLLRRNQQGVALLEFALTLPILITLFIGVVEITRFVLINQKVDKATSTMADLTAQIINVTDANMVSLTDAFPRFIRPYQTSGTMDLIFTFVERNDPLVNGQPQPSPPKVVRQFSSTPGGVGRSQVGPVGSPAKLPAGFAAQVQDKETIIVAESWYDFSPILTQNLLPGIELYKVAFTRPRLEQFNTCTLACLNPGDTLPASCQGLTVPPCAPPTSVCPTCKQPPVCSGVPVTCVPATAPPGCAQSDYDALPTCSACPACRPNMNINPPPGCTLAQYLALPICPVNCPPCQDGTCTFNPVTGQQICIPTGIITPGCEDIPFCTSACTCYDGISCQDQSLPPCQGCPNCIPNQPGWTPPPGCPVPSQNCPPAPPAPCPQCITLANCGTSTMQCDLNHNGQIDPGEDNVSIPACPPVPCPQCQTISPGQPVNTLCGMPGDSCSTWNNIPPCPCPNPPVCPGQAGCPCPPGGCPGSQVCPVSCPNPPTCPGVAGCPCPPQGCTGSAVCPPTCPNPPTCPGVAGCPCPPQGCTGSSVCPPQCGAPRCDPSGCPTGCESVCLQC